ncbi:MAG: UvrD-helicase domain-containing protein, partial [Clostridia bacterium]|nr:UvrD-helicase domain-containing protein [Clostridia bacterium]
MPSFNKSQKAAISAENQNILVSAAAGSGKTTVMVEKIKQTLIDHPESSISEFLVITFTKDAARNMKDKLRLLLEEAAREGVQAASRALGEIETATISTIHAFCNMLLKEFNDDAGASLNPRLLKEGEKTRMLDEGFGDAIEAILGEESAYSQSDRQTASALLSAFGLDEIKAMVRALYDVLMGIPDPFEFLDRIIENPPYELWNKEMLTSVGMEVRGLNEQVLEEEDLMLSPDATKAYQSVVESDALIVSSLIEEYESTDSLDGKIALLERSLAAFADAPRSRITSPEEKQWRDRINDVRKKLKGTNGVTMTCLKKLRFLADDEGNESTNERIKAELRGLKLILVETAKQYEIQKLESGAIDYSDMEQVAYRIMS